jgi:aspartyl protease family protein
MSGDENVRFFILITLAVIIAASLFSRRLPIRDMFKMLAGWVAIFAVLIVAFSFRNEAKQVWKRVKSEVVPNSSIDEDGSIRIPMSDDGHFWVDANVDGQNVRLMVDSGASQTSLGYETANGLGISIDESGFAIPVDTANGTVKAYRAQIKRLKVGPIIRGEFGILVSRSFGDTSVIGMDFLSSLDGWRVEGRELILNPGK